MNRLRGWLIVGALSAAVGIGAVAALGSGSATAGGGLPPSLTGCHQEGIDNAWQPMRVDKGTDPAVCAEIDHTKPQPMWGPGPTGFLTNQQGLVRLFLTKLPPPMPGSTAAAAAKAATASQAAQPNPALSSPDPLVRQNAMVDNLIATGQMLEVQAISLADLKASVRAGKGY